MWAAIRSSWPLFAGMVFLMVSNGLLATLLTLRADGLGFGETVIGRVQSGYPAGSLLGCLVAPRLVLRVGQLWSKRQNLFPYRDQRLANPASRHLRRFRDGAL